jgi:hypothetical protein
MMRWLYRYGGRAPERRATLAMYLYRALDAFRP